MRELVFEVSQDGRNSENIKQVHGSIKISTNEEIKRIDFLGFDICVYAGFSLIKQGFIDHEYIFEDTKITLNDNGLLNTKEECDIYINEYLKKNLTNNIEPIDEDDIIDIVELYEIQI